MLNEKAKEAIRVSLSLVTVFYIGMSVGWMNPSWAAFAVAMVALAGGSGPSLRKGVMRLYGSGIGCLAALVILSLVPQSRTGFVALGAFWVSIMTYVNLVDKERAYMWSVAGWTCLLIAVTGPSSSENAFQHALFRTLETGMGVVVYTLFSVFLWPVNNSGLVKKSSAALLDTQSQLLLASQELILQQTSTKDASGLRKQQIQQLAQMQQALATEGPESYEIHQQRKNWGRLHGLCSELMQALDRLSTGLQETRGVSLISLLPEIPDLYSALNQRLKRAQNVLSAKATTIAADIPALSLNKQATEKLSPLQIAALAGSSKDLKNIAALTTSIDELVTRLTDENPANIKTADASRQDRSERPWTPPVIDLEHLRGSVFAGLAVICGYLVWNYFDPPGHSGWYSTAAPLAMAVAGAQQLKVTTLIKPITLASLMCLVVYVFVMPRLSTFMELGTLLFILMFINCYFFTGLAKVAGMLGILTELAIQNQQSYNFAAMANGLLFMVMLFIFLFALSYLLSSSRPEKAMLGLLNRYFRSVGYLFSAMATDPADRNSWKHRWKVAFSQYELNTLPTKIAAWAHFIDQKLFPENTPEKAQGLVESLQNLVLRMQSLIEASDDLNSTELREKVRSDLRPWLIQIQKAFTTWSTRPEAGSDNVEQLQQKLSSALNQLEERIDSRSRQHAGKMSLNQSESENVLRVLGGMRGVSEASVAYAGVAAEIDWDHWREERFS